MKLLIALIVAFILFELQRYIYQKYWDKGLRITISFSDAFVREGDRSTLLEIIENNKRMPLPILQVKFAITRTFSFADDESSAVTDNYYRSDFFSMKSYCRITRSYPFVCTKRGCYFMNDMDLIGRDFFIATKCVKSIKHSSYICVLPKRIVADEIPECAIQLMGEIVRNSKLYEDPFEFRGLREYTNTDSMRKINWKASARGEELMINQYNSTYSRDVVIILNLKCAVVSAYEDIAEQSIRIADCIATKLLSEHVSVAFVTNGLDAITGEACRVDSGSGNTHIHSIEIVMSRIDINAEPVDLLQILERETVTCGKSCEYIIVSNYRRKEFLDEMDSYTAKGYNIRLVVPEYVRIPLGDRIKAQPNVIKWELKEKA